MINAVSKTQTSIAEKFTASGVDINESQTQNSVEQFIAKLSYILHNFFTKSKFNVGLNDDNINKAVIKIAVQCKYVLEQHLINPEESVLKNGKSFEIELIPNVKIKLVIKDNVFKVYIVENEEAFYFPKTEKLLSIDLTKPNKMKSCIKIMDKVLSSDISPYKNFCKLINIQVTEQHRFIDLLLPNALISIFIPYAKENFEEFKFFLSKQKSITRQSLDNEKINIENIIALRLFHYLKWSKSILQEFVETVNNDNFIQDILCRFDEKSHLELMQLLAGMNNIPDDETCKSLYVNLMYTNSALINLVINN